MRKALYALPLVLAACAPPEPITDYNAPYEGKYAPVASVRPEPRPVQRRWLACPNAAVNDDCGNGSVPTPDIWTYQAQPLPNGEPNGPSDSVVPADPVDGGGVVPGGDRPVDTPAPVPEPPAVEPPEAPEPPPEAHEPPPQECPA
jgi:hypothetical protein